MHDEKHSAPAPLIDDTRAAELLGVAPKTLQNWRQAGTGPRWLKIGKRMVRYRLADLESFAEAGEGRAP